MDKFSELNLKSWQKEDLKDVFEEYPELENMTLEEMEDFVEKLYEEAGCYITQANSLESKADSFRCYIRAIIGSKYY